MQNYHVETFPVGALQCNCSLLINSKSSQMIVVDPGDEAKKIFERIVYHKSTVKALWHTHAHLDHIGATQELYNSLCDWNQKNNAEKPIVYLSKQDHWLYENVAIQAQMLGMGNVVVPKEYSDIKHGQVYEGFEGASSLFTPGHTPGSCCLHVQGKSDLFVPQNFKERGEVDSLPTILFSGDTLFKRSIGRTDLWGGDSNLISKSIKNKIYTLSEETIVIPGHGPLTSVEMEKKKNPFVSAS